MKLNSRPLFRCAQPAWLLLALLAPTLAWAQGGPRDIHFDLPVGSCQDSKLVLGNNHYVMREYETINTRISTRCTDTHDCYHSGIDISRVDGPANMPSNVVYAVADGRVLCKTDWDTQGSGVGIAHLLEDGSTLYSHYVHLNDDVFVEEGQLVRRGQPIGTIISWPGDATNSHLHFEIRSGEDVTYLPPGDNSTPTTNCRGNGYSVISRPNGGATTSQLGAWGFIDPTDTFFATRPTFPGWIRTQVAVDAKCQNSLEIHSTPDPSNPTTRAVAANQWHRAFGVAGELDDDTNDQDELERGWYRLESANSAEYVLGSTEKFSGIRSAICIGEPYRVGRQWTPPTFDPLVDLRFGQGEANGTTLTNWAQGGTALTVSGPLPLVPPYEIPSGELCDLAGELAGGTFFEMTPVATAFQGGVAFEARLRLDAVGGERILAERWGTGEEQWRLLLEESELVFIVRQSTGNDLTLRYTLPEPQCNMQGPCPNSCNPDDLEHPECVLSKGWQQWVHVAASADPLVDGDMELYWDGARVGRLQLVVPLAESTAPLRIGEGIDGMVDDVVIWSLETRNRPVDVAFVVDTTGSMWDDLARVKAASTQIVQALDAASASYRVAVTDFRDHPVRPYGTPGIDYPFRVGLDFSNSPPQIIAAIDALRIGDGWDWPESVYSGVMGAIRSRTDGTGKRLSGWRPGVEKILLLIGDAPPQDPEPFTGFTDDDVILAAQRGGFEIGDPLPEPAVPARSLDTSGERTPVHIFSIVIGGDQQARAAYRRLAEGTGGELFFASNASQIVNAILAAIGSIGGGGGIPVNNPPEVSGAFASSSQLWPPNRRMQEIQIQNVYDPEGGPVSLTITGITQDEAVSSGGKKEVDGEGVGSGIAKVRAERLGNSHEGRVYRIAFTATDAAGASSAGSVLVCVPHDQGPNVSCVDDGQLYDSTKP